MAWAPAWTEVVIEWLPSIKRLQNGSWALPHPCMDSVWKLVWQHMLQVDFSMRMARAFF